MLLFSDTFLIIFLVLFNLWLVLNPGVKSSVGKRNKKSCGVDGVDKLCNFAGNTRNYKCYGVQ